MSSSRCRTNLSWLALQNKKVVYDLLFRTSAATLLEIAADPKHLGAEIGFLSVLHTWGQNLQHPSPHSLRDPLRWSVARPPALGPSPLPILPAGESAQPCLSRQVCRWLEARLSSTATAASRQPESTGREKAFHAFLRPLFRQDWVVYAKRPFGGPEACAALPGPLHPSRRHLQSPDLIFADGKVTFRWKDYAHGGKQRKMTVTAEEFLRRFMLHVLPRGFVRIRFSGFLANRRRQRATSPLQAVTGGHARMHAFGDARKRRGKASRAVGFARTAAAP